MRNKNDRTARSLLVLSGVEGSERSERAVKLFFKRGTFDQRDC